MIKQLPYSQSPTNLFQALRNQRQPALLHSADRSNRFGRYDVLTADPTYSVRWQGGYLSCGQQRIATAKPLDVLGRLHRQFVQQLQPTAKLGANPPPFTAGFVGYFGYPLHQTLEQQQPTPQDPTPLPDLQGGFYDWAIITDHLHQTTNLYADTPGRAEQVLEWVTQAKPNQAKPNGALPPQLRASNDLEPYTKGFQRIQSYLAAGDCYQVNLARHFTSAFVGDPWDLYQAWCNEQAAPFNAYLDFSIPGARPTALLSLSPERFMQIDDQRITVCPIKGTIGRGADSAHDANLAAQLLANPKDLAENLMIVDLLRNDLGRISKVGSVEVSKLFELLQFSNVQHLVSTITGKLEPTTSAMQAFKALFPSGSITGAPKIRAIDIINELEPVGRSVYCGSIGYWDRSGRFDSNVAIRTGVVADGQVHLWGGGGVVSDSKCEAELEEIQQKVGRLLS